MRIGVVTGLAAEAACLAAADAGIIVACAGADAERAAAAAERLIADGCQGLVSFGLCGALAADLLPGGLVLADLVIEEGGATYRVDEVWCDRLATALGALQPRTAPLLGRPVPALEPSEKRRLWEETGAVAVDMESAAVARVAGCRGIPFIVVRAVADGSTTTVPAVAAQAVGADGRPRLAPIIGRLVLRPALLPAMIRLGRDAGRGMATLRRVAALAGLVGGFQFPL